MFRVAAFDIFCIFHRRRRGDKAAVNTRKQRVSTEPVRTVNRVVAFRPQRKAPELAAATRSLADLRALHERIVESIRSGVITTDLQGHIYTFNAAAEEITGYKASDVRGQDASIFFGDMTRQIADSMNAAATGKVSPRFQADCLTPDGLALRLGFSIAPLSGESGETSGMVITFQDLTDIRALEETSRRQDRMAAVGRLAASIAHEIRNPLAAMRGSIQMLRSEMDGNTEQAQLMEIILRESDRLNKIVADYLNYARPRPAELKKRRHQRARRRDFQVAEEQCRVKRRSCIGRGFAQPAGNRFRRSRAIETGLLEYRPQRAEINARRWKVQRFPG